jgi:hypothetical protein
VALLQFCSLRRAAFSVEGGDTSSKGGMGALPPSKKKEINLEINLIGL